MLIKKALTVATAMGLGIASLTAAPSAVAAASAGAALVEPGAMVGAERSADGAPSPDVALSTESTPTAQQLAACSAPVRWASSSNRIYVSGGSVTLSDIKRLCPSAPLQHVDATSAIWQLNADLVLERGATLTMQNRAVGGDVDQLRLRSGSSGILTEVASITAQYGTIVMQGVKARSWDPVENRPDTDTAIPSGGLRGRAFIRAVSYMEGSSPRESRMDILGSDVGYLGYYGAEAYGISYKARGCGLDTPAICDVLDVLGRQVDSRFHHNFMGTYTWGAFGMEFRNNEYDNNESYGLDPHDDSDSLMVTGNSFNNNGNHGFICSQRCDHLTITGNESHDNGHTPWVGPGDDDPADNQVHGIMLHRGVTDTLVADNRVWNHPTGAGIAVFDSVGNTVRNNDVSNSKYGLRFSVGTSGTQVVSNRVTNSGTYALFTYKGSDAPVYTGTSGRPAGIVFQGNVFTGSGSDLFKIQDSDRFTFAGGSIGGPMPSGPRFERSRNHVYDVSVATPAATRFTLRGTSASRTSITFQGMKPTAVKLSKDSFSTAKFTG